MVCFVNVQSVGPYRLSIFYPFTLQSKIRTLDFLTKQLDDVTNPVLT
jgi:hypothetical protein